MALFNKLENFARNLGDKTSDVIETGRLNAKIIQEDDHAEEEAAACNAQDFITDHKTCDRSRKKRQRTQRHAHKFLFLFRLVDIKICLSIKLHPFIPPFVCFPAAPEGTKRICKERWEGTKRCDVVFESKGSIYAARALTGTGLQVKGELMLLGREQKQGEFLFDILENGAVVGTARNEKDGSLTFSQIRYLPEDEGAHVYTVRQRSGEKADITYDEREYALGVMVKKEDGGMTASVTGLTRDGKPASSLRFENKYALTDFTVYNLWQGGNEGQIELWLYANGEKLKKQPEYAVDGAKYIYANLPMFAEDGSRIVYSAREIYVDDYMAMYVNTGEYAARTKMLYNGGTVINRRVLDFAFRMMYAGMNGRPEPKVQFTLYCNGKPYYMATQPATEPLL